MHDNQIFNTHLKDTVPEGIYGALYVNATPPDSLGVRGGDYWHAPEFGDHMVCVCACVSVCLCFCVCVCAFLFTTYAYACA